MHHHIISISFLILFTTRIWYDPGILQYGSNYTLNCNLIHIICRVWMIWWQLIAIPTYYNPNDSGRSNYKKTMKKKLNTYELLN